MSVERHHFTHFSLGKGDVRIRFRKNTMILFSHVGQSHLMRTLSYNSY